MIYLNNAATTYPKPDEVTQAVTDTLVNLPGADLRNGFNKTGGDIKTVLRNNLTDFFDTNDDTNQMIINSGSTIGINNAIFGLDLDGSHIISTVIEHNSVNRPLNYLQKIKNINIDYAECDESGFVDPDDIKKLIKSNTKLIVINHCSNVTGTVQDLKSICNTAHEYDAIVLSDSSQSAGAIEYSVSDIGIDIMAFTGHKSLYGIQGTGGLYVKSGIDIQPIISGGTGIHGEDKLQPDKMPFKLEAGTSNIPGFAALNAGINSIRKIGTDKIHNKKKHLVKKMISEFEDNPDIKIYNSKTNDSYTIFAFNLKGEVPEEINFILENSFDIKIRSGIHCAPNIRKYIGSYPFGTLRVSPSYFTKEEEIDYFIESLYKIIGGYK